MQASSLLFMLIERVVFTRVFDKKDDYQIAQVLKLAELYWIIRIHHHTY